MTARQRQQLVVAIVVLAVLYLLAATLFNNLSSALIFAAGYILARVTGGVSKYFEYPARWTCKICQEDGKSTTFKTNNVDVLEGMKEDHILTFHS